MDIRAWIFAPSVVLLLGHAEGASPPVQGSQVEPLHVSIEALADQEALEPGQTFRVALVEHIERGWHTYWINPGDAGQPTKLLWTLPVGYSIEAVQWPVPQVFRSGPLVTYGYEGETVLLQSVHTPSRLSSSPVRLSVEAQWLACQDICIPEHAQAQLTLRKASSASHPAPSAARERIAAASERLPRPCPWTTSLAVRGTHVVLTLHGISRALPAAAKLQFLPLKWGEIDNAAPQRTARSGADVLLRLERGDLRSSPLEELDGVLVLGPGSGESQGQGFLLHALASNMGTPSAR